jgi:UDP-N-acetylmuramyl pentapeptide phosphotransferase/UDP-N-acetylglucosamine-1-phosphate transferase
MSIGPVSLQAYGVTLFATALVSTTATAAVIRVGSLFQLVDRPRPDRWSSRSVPRGGGLAVLTACSVGYLIMLRPSYGTLALGSWALAIIGLLDDRYCLSPLSKFLLQSLVTAVVVSTAHVTIQVSTSDVANTGASFLWIVTMTNAFNFIDNLDGLCTGVTVIICSIQAAVLAVRGFTGESLAFAIIGVSFLAFLGFNKAPARLYLGDCGSPFAGFVLSTLIISCPLVSARRPGLPTVAFLLLTFGVPAFDLCLVTITRSGMKRPFWQGGRDHTSHRLVSWGLRERTAVSILWITCGVSGSLASLLE